MIHHPCMQGRFSLNPEFGQALTKLNIYHPQYGHSSASNPSFSPALLGVEYGLLSIFHWPSEGATVSPVCLYNWFFCFVLCFILLARTESRITASRQLFYPLFQVKDNNTNSRVVVAAHAFNSRTWQTEAGRSL